MQIYLFESSPHSRKLLNEPWLKSRESPENVFNMLHLSGARLNGDLKESSKLLQWFRYTELYRSSMGSHSFTDFEAYQFLRSVFQNGKIDLSLLFQSLKQTSGLEKLGDNMQTFLFQSWIRNDNFTPKYVKSQLALPWGTAIFELRKDDVMYRTLEEYTIFYAEKRGGHDAIRAVRTLFTEDKPNDALALAKKL
ncbi:unnamed protein product [Phytophthora fragariaefolia]|uniref:Unnamed protein product n=1 Tax=Phytophthora fragariaefolia TaxID=1490495 RepID=A0A9W6XVY0_9STRA|nr:unnamed protein product [Phytophthora fragariaefolia]